MMKKIEIVYKDGTTTVCEYDAERITAKERYEHAVGTDASRLFDPGKEIVGYREIECYTIRYNTGAGDEEVNGTLDEAKAVADDGAAYTQQDIVIEDESGDEVARRVWYGVELTEEDMTEDEDQYITFGSFGYYAPWQEVGGND